MSLLIRLVLGGFSWMDSILAEVISEPTGTVREMSSWFSRIFVCVPYALPLIFYWNAVRGRYLMFVVCTSAMLSSMIKNILDSIMLFGPSQSNPCYRKTSVSVPAVTIVCFWHVLFDFEPLWFDSARRNMCTIFFAFISFLMDCPFGKCILVSFTVSYLLAIAAIRFRHALVVWYETHLSKIWVSVAAIMLCALILGFQPCRLNENNKQAFQGGVSCVMRPLGCVVGLIVCDKLDKSAYIRSHICGKGLSLGSWLAYFVVGVFFTCIDFQLTFQSYMLSSLAIPTLLIVYTVISCRVVPLLDLTQVEKRNSRFMESLTAAMNSCRKSRARNLVNIGQMRKSSPYVDSVQESLNKATSNFIDMPGIRDPEMTDLMKVTSTTRNEDVLNPPITTKRILRTDTSCAKICSDICCMYQLGIQEGTQGIQEGVTTTNFTAHGMVRCDSVAVSVEIAEKDVKVAFPLALPLRPGSSASDTHVGGEVRSSSPTPASR